MSDSTRSRILEVIAREIGRRLFGTDLDRPDRAHTKRSTEEACERIAEVALTAYESHLSAEGMAVVPRALVERVVRIREWNHDEYGDACREYDSAADDLRDALPASPYGKASMQEASA